MRMPATESSDWLGQHQLARSSRAGLPRRQQAGLQSPHGQPDASDWVPFARLLRTSETLVWLAAALASMRLVPVGTALFAARPVSGAFVCGKPKYVSPTDMKSGGATSTHALTASCSQRSPSLRPVEPISAMPRPRRPPQLSAHAQACSIDHPLCNPSCAVSAPCRRRKEVVSGVLSFSPWVWPAGDGWSRDPSRRTPDRRGACTGFELTGSSEHGGASNDPAGSRNQGGRYGAIRPRPGASPTSFCVRERARSQRGECAGLNKPRGAR
jgi:hypothetical protein